mmetsp:Transcript_83656/g.240427  ORF Transcript_83656/g.240427 Transcript_83656/m.240427 type:complete len:109 (+) Transcript_83656:1230-1556(+)
MVPQPWRARSGRLLRGQCKCSCGPSYFALGFPAQEKLCAARLPSRQCALTVSGMTGRKFVPRSVSNVLLLVLWRLQLCPATLLGSFCKPENASSVTSFSHFDAPESLA